MAALRDWMAQAGLTAIAVATDDEREIEAIDRVCDQVAGEATGEKLSIDSFARLLTAGLQSLKLGRTPTKPDAVVLAEVQRSRLGEVRRAIVGGLSARDFPRVVASERFFTEGERILLARMGLDLGTPDPLRQEEEAYFLYIALTRASESLLLTRPTTDVEGSSLDPSPFLEEIRSALPGLVEIAPEVEEDPADLAGAQTVEELAAHVGAYIASRLDRRLAGRGAEPDEERAMPADKKILTVYNCLVVPQPGWRIDARSLLAESGRSWGYCNRASLPEEVARLAIGERTHTASVGRLESFARCPYQHFARHLLRLERRAEAKVTPLENGLLTHRALEVLMKQGAPSLDPGAIERRLSGVFDSIQGEPDMKAFSVVSGGPFRWQSTQGRLRRFLEIEALRLADSEFRPAEFEREFGTAETRPLRIPLPDGRALLLRGRIDRIDVAETGGRREALVIDYKSGAILDRGRPADLMRGTDLQLAVYLLVASEVLGLEPFGALYAPVLPKPQIGAVQGSGEPARHQVHRASADGGMGTRSARSCLPQRLEIAAEDARRAARASARGARDAGALRQSADARPHRRGSRQDQEQVPVRLLRVQGALPRGRGVQPIPRLPEGRTRGGGSLVSPPLSQIQKLVVDQLAMSKERDLLVSAGAGSGKTTILVASVIAALRAGVPLERILVVTFTEKAAAEMKNKIYRAMGSHEDLAPLRLRLPQAWISTIHSFCMRLLRERFQKAGVDPRFRILSEEDAKLLLADANTRVFHDWYEKARRNPKDPFEHLVEMCGFGPDGENLRAVICELLAYARTSEDPERFLSGHRELLRGAGSAWQELPWRDDFATRCARAYRTAVGLLRALVAEVGDAPAWTNKLRAIESIDPARLATPEGQRASLEQMAALGVIPDASAFKVRLPSVPRGMGGKLEDLRKATTAALKDAWLAGMPVDETSVLADERAAEWLGLPLVALAEDVARGYEEAKSRTGRLDFEDLQIKALRLIEDTVGTASAIRFDRVFIDEFQDVNGLQHRILEQVCDPTRIFRVGDVKQSIYQFRLAEPGIIRGLGRGRPLVEENETTPEDSPEWNVLLPRNHRSLPPVLEVVNAVAGSLFFEEEIGTEYGKQALVPGPETPLEGPNVELMLVRDERKADSKRASDSKEGDDEADAESEAEGQDPPGSTAPDPRDAEWSAIAARIKEVVRPGSFVRDPETRMNRQAVYSDIAILLRAHTRAPALARRLEEEGIPCSVSTGESFFEAPEVRDLTSLLSAIDNMLDDIALASALRSPAFGWLDAELLSVRLAYPRARHIAFALACLADRASQDGTYGRALLPEDDRFRAALCGEPAELPGTAPFATVPGKARIALDRFLAWREAAGSIELPDLVSRVLEESGLSRSAASLPGGLAPPRESTQVRGDLAPLRQGLGTQSEPIHALARSAEGRRREGLRGAGLFGVAAGGADPVDPQGKGPRVPDRDRRRDGPQVPAREPHERDRSGTPLPWPAPAGPGSLHSAPPDSLEASAGRGAIGRPGRGEAGPLRRHDARPRPPDPLRRDEREDRDPGNPSPGVPGGGRGPRRDGQGGDRIAAEQEIVPSVMARLRAAADPRFRRPRREPSTRCPLDPSRDAPRDAPRDEPDPGSRAPAARPRACHDSRWNRRGGAGDHRAMRKAADTPVTRDSHVRARKDLGDRVQERPRSDGFHRAR